MILDSANPEHLAILKKGVQEWNAWRQQNPYVIPVLAYSSLGLLDLSGANLSKADLSGCSLQGSIFQRANLYQIELFCADLRGCDLSSANLQGAKLDHTDLCGASLRETDLYRADFIATRLDKTDFTRARCLTTAFSNVDLSNAIGLQEVMHSGPSSVDVATLARSGGRISEAFLHGVGLPDVFIDYLPSLLSSGQPIQFNSCFISYSHQDEIFAKQLHLRLRRAHIRVWFASEDIRGGEKLHDQIERAIQIHDKLLVVLSENSLQSEWVITEIRNARKIEVQEKRRKLFPIRLVDFQTIQRWKCFDAETGKDLAIEVREYFIPNFSDWKDQNAFEAAAERLLRDLKAETTP